MAITSLIGTAAGAGVQALGAHETAAATSSMYNFQTRVAQINANIAQEQGRTEEMAGEVKAEQSGLKTAERAGFIRDAAAAGGLDPGSGSAKQVLGSTYEVGQFEGATIRNDAARRAFGYNVSAFGDTAQASLDTAAGRNAIIAGDFNVGTSILGGATSVSDKWVKFGQEGIPPFGTPPPPVTG